MKFRNLLNYISLNYFKIGIVSYGIGNIPLSFSREDHDYFHGITWKLTAFHMNYIDFGFIKRGVIGTAIKPLFDILDDGGFGEALFMIAFDIILFIFILYIFSKVVDDLLCSSEDLKAYLKSIAVLSPLGITQIAYDVGRLDHLNFLILAASITLIARDKFILASITVVFGILIHEAFFIYGAPIIIAFAISQRMELWKSYVLFFAAMYSAVIILFYGNASVAPDMILSENIAYGVEVWNRGLFIHKLPLSLWHYIPIILYIASTYIVIYRIYLINNMNIDLIFVSTLTPLALFFVGEDYFRWSQIVMVVVLAAILIKARERPLRFSCPEWRLRDTPLLLLILPIGPIGVDMGFPVASKVIRVLAGSPW